MKKIDWKNFDGSVFQKFCNSLLLFNVSKFAHVFTAAGRDNGVDQLYSGTFESKTGKWRFQDKFHLSGRTTADIASLKKDILIDIRQNYNGENFIVFITNVNLTVGKHASILNEAEKLLINLNILNCEIILWHEPNIEGFLANYPMVANWFWHKESVLLQPYEEYFYKQLAAMPYELRNQLNNPFFGREDQLNYLKEFVEDPSKSVLALIANGGYGKTRLVLEFFRGYISQTEEWLPLVMTHTGFDPSAFNALLQSNKRLLILADNAHEIPEIISEAKRMIDNSVGKHKLIVTTRPALFSEIVQKWPSHNREFEKIYLKSLPYNQRKAMFQATLPGLQEGHIISLSQLSKGVPNVILEFISLIKAGKQPQDITNEETFNQSVQEIFSEAARDLENKTKIPADQIYDFLRLIAVISPVQNKPADKEFIASFTDIRADKLELLIYELTQLNLFESRYSLSLKPDPYSDSLLSETIYKNKSFIQLILKHKGAENYLENILKNLSEAEIKDNEKAVFIDKLIGGYVSLLKEPATEPQKIKNIYEFVEKIGFHKPKYAVIVVNQFLLYHEDASHQTHGVPRGWSQKSYFDEIKELTFKILEVLATYTAYSREHKEEIYELVRKFIMVTGDYKILNHCYIYHEWDFLCYGYMPQNPCEKQLFLSSKTCQILQSSQDETDLKIALAAAGVLMVLEFDLQHLYEEATMQMRFGHASVPTTGEVVIIRTNIINALILFHHSDNHVELKNQALDLLLQYIFYSCNNYFTRYQQNISNEISIVLNYLESFLATGPIAQEKNSVLSAIQRFEQSDFRPEFRDQVMRLRVKACETTSLYESLEMILLNEDYFDNRAHGEERTLNLVNEYGYYLH